MTAILATDRLDTGYRAGGGGRRVVLGAIDLALTPGEFVCLLGPNGAGKSTLLRTLAGAHPPIAGTVTIAGHDVGRLTPRQRAQYLAVVLAERIEPGLLSAQELVALGRHPHTGWTGRLGPHDHARVGWALDATGTRPFVDRRVAELSDGERQRVMVARALAQDPLVLLLDEATAFLDVTARVALLSLLRRLAHDHGLAVLLATHDLELALRLADQIWLAHGGRLVTGSPEDLMLSGALEAAFSSAGARFDIATGGFTPHDESGPLAVVRGQDEAAVLAGHTLTRVGYRVVVENGEAPADAALTVTAEWGDTGREWRVEGSGHDGDARVAGSLGALADLASRRRPVTATTEDPDRRREPPPRRAP